VRKNNLHDIELVRRVAGIELGKEDIPDGSTILTCHHLVEKYGLTESFLQEVNDYVSDQFLVLVPQEHRKLAEAAGGGQYVAAVVVDNFVDRARQFVGIDRIRRIHSIAILLGKRRHHRHDAFEVIGSNHSNLLELVLPDSLIGGGGSKGEFGVICANHRF
jgi:hypothetical protein